MNSVYSPDDIQGTVSQTSSNNITGTGGDGGLESGYFDNLVDVADPGLGPLANNGGPTQTMALLAGSPAAGAPALTYRAATRPTSAGPAT